MNNGKVQWAGNMPAVATPFTKDGEIDRPKFIQLIEMLVAEGASGVVVSGSNGESWALKAAERISLFKTAKDVLGKSATVIGGTGTIVTDDVIEMTRAAHELGIDGVMIMTPYYCGATRRDIVGHYKAISDAVPMPILVYNTPRGTGFDIPGDMAAELADIEWVCGLKQGNPEFLPLQNVIAHAGDKIRILSGHSGKRGLPAVMVGAVGFVSSNDTNIMGREGISLWSLSASGRYDEARKVQSRTLALDMAIGSIAAGPVVMKTAMNLLGRPGGYPRRPLLPATGEQEDKIRQALDTLGLFSQSRHAA